jgi:hypothetical protein
LAVKNLIETLESLINDADERIALDSCVSIGKLGIKQSKQTKLKLVNIIQTSRNWSHKALALEALVKLFDAKNSKIMKFIMTQLETCSEWMGRCSACKLLSHLGSTVVASSENAEAIYKILETRLSDDPIQEVRLSIGRTIKDLKIYQRTLNKLSKLAACYLYWFYWLFLYRFC